MGTTLVVGRIIKPHGVAGEVVVEPRTDNPSRFEPGSRLLSGDSELTVISSRPQGPRLLVRFAGVEDRTSAERLRGAELVAQTGQEAPHLPNGSYWVHELLGFAVVTDSGRSLGRLEDVRENPAHDLWVVRDHSGGETLIPAVQELIVSVDRADSRIVVRELQGLTGAQDD